MSGWIGVDFDRTLAVYNGWKGYNHLGEPIMPMVDRIKRWLANGVEVRIFTARWCDVENRQTLQTLMHAWLAKLDIPPLKITNEKDFDTIEIWDDIAVGVEPNTGQCRMGPTGRPLW
ncbi:hypothetical protein KEU06_08825 [Pseudaminobacter sp. 19-2017]|uniref:Polynucleotide kinase n=1 Tax=Pseudaminobacter soli (ex Zhang et al. 2022) TaxID=2831468 RepID=A0A942E0F9_9HYPH|nr:hypothetical protein [Pseudaminobacter soli]MBS3648731.1 hypothetical protein [Pseudaminobacter soli]